MDIWIAVWLTQFIMVFIINAFTLVVFARSRHLRRRNTYLIMNLTVADLLIAAVSGPETILLLKENKRPKKGFGVLHVYLIISDMCWIASLGNLVLISLERLHATLYPFRHCLVGKRIYYKIIIFSWFGALTLACGLQIIRMNNSPLADRYPWTIYVFSYPSSTNNILCHNYFKIYYKTSCPAVRVSHLSRKKTFSSFIHS